MWRLRWRGWRGGIVLGRGEVVREYGKLGGLGREGIGSSLVELREGKGEGG